MGSLETKNPDGQVRAFHGNNVVIKSILYETFAFYYTNSYHNREAKLYQVDMARGACHV